MERITPEQVKAAYQETGYKVLRHGYELQHDDGLATCPFALTLARLKRNDGGVSISPVTSHTSLVWNATISMDSSVGSMTGSNRAESDASVATCWSMTDAKQPKTS